MTDELIDQQDNKIHLYSWNGTELSETGALETPRGAVTSLAFSPDSTLLVAGDVGQRSISIPFKMLIRYPRPQAR